MSLKKAASPFQFVTEVSLTRLTTRKASNLTELLKHLSEVSGSSIYLHTHHFLKQHQFLSPEPPNDFAHWVNSALQDERLAEKLASIDTVRFTTIRSLREKIIQTIQVHMEKNKSRRDAPPGDEFRFMQAVSFVMPTPFVAWDLQEFSNALKKISINSLYHHIFEARIRGNQDSNDFFNWFAHELGEIQLAQAIAKMDPYTQTLEGLRKRIITQVDKQIREAEHAKA